MIYTYKKFDDNKNGLDSNQTKDLLKTKLKVDYLEDFEDAVDFAFSLTCARFNVDKIALEQS